METLKCLTCDGLGYTSEHSTHPHPDGDCCGECPVAVQCDYCEGKGFLTGEDMLRNERIRRVSEAYQKQLKESRNQLPF